jgi:hypothetical protein
LTLETKTNLQFGKNHKLFLRLRGNLITQQAALDPFLSHSFFSVSLALRGFSSKVSFM